MYFRIQREVDLPEIKVPGGNVLGPAPGAQVCLIGVGTYVEILGVSYPVPAHKIRKVKNRVSGDCPVIGILIFTGPGEEICLGVVLPEAV